MKYAILRLRTLQVSTYDNVDDWRGKMSYLRKGDIPCVTFKRLSDDQPWQQLAQGERR